jgi:uncharacterized membrane protein YkoI
MFKLNNKKIIALIGSLVFSPAALAVAEFDLGDINGCLAAAHKIKPKANFLKIEELTYKKTIIYEIEVQDSKEAIWELACRAGGGGVIFQVTRELKSADDPVFAEASEVSEADARAKALSEFPGEIVETEYERRVPGSSLYEFSIINKYGQDTRVKVDAMSGNIAEAIVEEWEIHWK